MAHVSREVRPHLVDAGRAAQFVEHALCWALGPDGQVAPESRAGAAGRAVTGREVAA